MPNIEISVEQEVPGGQIFSALIARTSDLTPLMQQLAGILFTANRRVFSTESTPQGARWAELAESTQRGKVHGGRVRGAHPILQATGDFYSTIQTTFGTDFAEIGTALDYPRYLQSGTSKMPAREVFGLGPQDESDILNAAAIYLASL